MTSLLNNLINYSMQTGLIFRDKQILMTTLAYRNISRSQFLIRFSLKKTLSQSSSIRRSKRCWIKCQTWSSLIHNKGRQRLWWKKHLTIWQAKMSTLKINLLKQKNYYTFISNSLMMHWKNRRVLYKNVDKVEQVLIRKWTSKLNFYKGIKCF